jgi:hypothetical protein
MKKPTTGEQSLVELPLSSEMKYKARFPKLSERLDIGASPETPPPLREVQREELTAHCDSTRLHGFDI